jgi:hypothetical protein
MTAGDLEAANRRLAGAESFTIAPSKYLGHYVAGNLAARHGIAVRLDNSPGNGITATVNLPPTLLTTEKVTSAPITPPHGQRAMPAPAPALLGTSPVPVPAPGDDAGLLGGSGSPEPAGAGPSAEGPSSAGLRSEPNGAGGPPPDGVRPPGRAVTTSSWRAPASLSPGTQPGKGAPPVPPAGDVPASDPQPSVAPASRTQSGLVKRAPRGSEPAPAPTAPGAASPASPPGGSTGGPDDDLLAALSRHSANLHAGRTGFPADPGSIPTTPAPPSPPAPPVSPVPPAPVGRATPTSGGVPGQVPPPPAPLVPPAPVRSTSGIFDPGGRRDGGRGPTEPNGHGAAGAAGGDPSTAAGLTRRVRGAQLPNTTPMSLRRLTGEHPEASPGGPPPRPRAPEQKRSADDVYGFLTSFTAGVQRGLDDARSGQDGDPDDR